MAVTHAPFTAAAPALLAALLFGASTPLAKLLVGDVAPLMLAGLLYLGSGVGLALLIALRAAAWWKPDHGRSQLRIPAADLPWLVARAVLLAWQSHVVGRSAGSLLIAAACLAWALDNDLTRKVSANDATLVACLKGLVAGVCNTTLAVVGGAPLPGLASLGAAVAVGFVGYGLSLLLFVVALRTVGTARTGAYFSVALLFGVLVALALWPALPPGTFWLAAVLMITGHWLHLRERHAHLHVHPAAQHEHVHLHDEHHLHAHDRPVDPDLPDAHSHRHAPLAHRHAHYPDIHHRHPH